VAVVDAAAWHDLTMPTAGSVPKNSLLHWPVPVTTFWTQLLLTPYWMVVVLGTENAWPSAASVVIDARA
jgi:hypothetical protein